MARSRPSTRLVCLLALACVLLHPLRADAAAVNTTLSDTVDVPVRDADTADTADDADVADPGADGELTVRGAAPLLRESEGRPDRSARLQQPRASQKDTGATSDDSASAGATADNDGNGAVAPLSSALDGLDEAGVHLPPMMKQMLSSALSGMDRAAGGLLSELSSNNVEFAKSRDGKTLVARLHVPNLQHGDHAASSANRTLHVAVVGQSHMRVRTEMTNGPFRTASTHTIRLPHPVSAKGVQISPAPDGSVHVHMRMLRDDEVIAPVGRQDGDDGEGDGMGDGMPDDPRNLLNQLFQNPLGMPMFNVLLPRRMLDPGAGDAEGGDVRDGGGDADGAPTDERAKQEETVAELPSAEKMLECRRTFGGDALRRRKCLCDVTPSDERRAVCYAELISRCVKVARRLRMDEFATSAKHIAMECADVRGGKTKCLASVTERVLGKLGEGVGGRRGRDGSVSLEGRIRTALESEDDGPSEFSPSTAVIVLRIIVVMVALLAVFVGGVAWLVRDRVLRGRAQSVMSQLSSVLAQSTSTAPTPRGKGPQGSPIVSPAGPRRNGGESTIMSPGRNKSTDKIS